MIKWQRNSTTGVSKVIIINLKRLMIPKQKSLLRKRDQIQLAGLSGKRNKLEANLRKKNLKLSWRPVLKKARKT